MPLLGCPKWQYDAHPSYPDALRNALVDVLTEMGTGHLDAVVHVPDTRRIHVRFFQLLTVNGYEYYAGHYRGSLSCLRGYEVGPSDGSAVYAQSAQVERLTDELAVRLRNAITQLDRVSAIPDWQVSASKKLTTVVAIACEVFSIFLLIHPYADGNGHAARFVVWALLMRYGYRPVRWTIDPRPPEPYIALLHRFRSGDVQPLQLAIIQAIVP